MRQRVKEVLKESVLIRWLYRMQIKISSFFASSAIGAWFGRDRIRHRKTDRWLERAIDSKFCDFVRSSALLGLIIKIPHIAFIALIFTAACAMWLPTIIVMLAAVLTLLLTVVSVIFRKETLPPFTDGLLFWGLWTGITLLYTFIGYGGIRGILSGGIRFVMLPLLPCAYILLSQKDRLWKSACILVGLSLPVGLYGLYQYISGGLSTQWTDTSLFSEELGRLTASFENPNIYGEFLLIMLPLSLVVCWYAKGWRQKTFFIATGLILLVNMFLTYSRGCYIALAVSALILLGKKDKRFLWIGVGLLLLSPLYLPASVWERVKSIGNFADTSTAYRVNIWKGCLAMLSRYWWVGVGIGDTAFRSIYEGFALKTVENAPHAHNLMLQTMCETGVLGLLCLILMFVFLFRTAHTNMRRQPHGRQYWLITALSAAWIGLLVQGMTDFIFYNNNLFCIMMISLGAMTVNIGQYPEKEMQNV